MLQAEDITAKQALQLFVLKPARPDSMMNKDATLPNKKYYFPSASVWDP
jgi:hypothetical protein